MATRRTATNTAVPIAIAKLIRASRNARVIKAHRFCPVRDLGSNLASRGLENQAALRTIRAAALRTRPRYVQPEPRPWGPGRATYNQSRALGTRPLRATIAEAIADFADSQN